VVKASVDSRLEKLRHDCGPVGDWFMVIRRAPVLRDVACGWAEPEYGDLHRLQPGTVHIERRDRIWSDDWER
jgi:hypothetical protein